MRWGLVVGGRKENALLRHTLAQAKIRAAAKVSGIDVNEQCGSGCRCWTTQTALTHPAGWARGGVLTLGGPAPARCLSLHDPHAHVDRDCH